MLGAAATEGTEHELVEQRALRVLPRLTSNRLGAAFGRLGVDASVLTAKEPLPGPGEALLVYGNATAARRRLAPLRDLAPGQRPRVVLWHPEPLPLPSGTGFPRQRRHLREALKVVVTFVTSSLTLEQSLTSILELAGV